MQVLSDTVEYAVDGAKPGPLRIQNALYVLRCVVHRVVHCFLLAQHVHEMLRNVEDMHPVCTLCILRLYICRHIHVSCIMYALYAYHVCTYVDIFIFLYGVCTVCILHLHICRHACFLVFCMYRMHITSVHMQTYALWCMVYVLYEYYDVCTSVDIRIVVCVCTVCILRLCICGHMIFLVFCMCCMHITSVHMSNCVYYRVGAKSRQR